MEGGCLTLERDPCRIQFTGVGPVSDEILQEHIRYALGSGFPFVEKERPREARRLAVVGGGPSVVEHLEELWAFDDIWAINQTASWLIAQGIPCTMFAIDPGSDVAGWTHGVEKALLASIVDPQVLKNLAGKDVRLFHTEHYPAKIQITGGPSAATRAQLLALTLGYAEVTWFGCEGSFARSTHAYRDEKRTCELFVAAGGKTFRTTPDYLMTTEYLADLIRKFRGIFREESGGLLRSIIEHEHTWSIIGMSEELKNQLDPTAQLTEIAVADLS